jgi:hypothetical protein
MANSIFCVEEKEKQTMKRYEAVSKKVWHCLVLNIISALNDIVAKKTLQIAPNAVALNPQANYTDGTTAAGRANFSANFCG